MDTTSTELHALAQQHGVQRSVWTIDLATLLRHYGEPHRYCTSMLGARASYADDAFYASSFVTDAQGVAQTFTRAQTEGWSVEERVLPTRALVEHVARGKVAIVLLDIMTLKAGDLRAAASGAG